MTSRKVKEHPRVDGEALLLGHRVMLGGELAVYHREHPEPFTVAEIRWNPFTDGVWIFVEDLTSVVVHPGDIARIVRERPPDGNCHTLPDGSCVGIDCMHDPESVDS